MEDDDVIAVRRGDARRAYVGDLRSLERFMLGVLDAPGSAGSVGDVSSEAEVDAAALRSVLRKVFGSKMNTYWSMWALSALDERELVALFAAGVVPPKQSACNRKQPRKAAIEDLVP